MEHIIDVKNKNLGRVATNIASILQGKNSPAFAPNKAGEDSVRVKNITLINISGRKAENKLYHHHTGYPGGLRTRTFNQIFNKHPQEVLFLAVKGMLPKNRLQSQRLKRLIIE